MSPFRLPTYFLSHGGGPWPWLKQEGNHTYDNLEASLKEMRRELGGSPRAVLMVSGHWEAERFLLSSSAQPRMEYDYFGFPQHTYHIRYEAPGDPLLAETVRSMLAAGGIAASLDPERGFDHGTFTLMHTIYPEAKLPIVQLSLNSGYDPGLHVRVGEILAPLRQEGVLIIGSGLSYHDLRGLRSGTGAKASASFDTWLHETLVSLPPHERRERLLRWVEAPAARSAHPREDHLLPLMVAVGAAGDDLGKRIYHETNFMAAITVSSYCFGTFNREN